MPEREREGAGRGGGGELFENIEGLVYIERMCGVYIEKVSIDVLLLLALALVCLLACLLACLPSM